MNSTIINNFIISCKRHLSSCSLPFECMEAVIPEFTSLMSQSEEWLCDSYLKNDKDKYARNVVYLDNDNKLGLYVLVWLPGQWTPVHDHGTWGVAGVLDGILYEHSFIRCDNQPETESTGIELVRTGSLLLSPGSVTSFISSHDHIHMTGNPAKQQVVSLHLYGHTMAGFNTYDVSKGTRKWTLAK